MALLISNSPFKRILTGNYSATKRALLHFDGPNNSTAFVDETGRIWTAGGGAKISTTQSKFGGSAGSFNGSTDYISAASSADFGVGASGDFTIECWVYQTAQAGDRGLFCVNANRGISFGLQNGKAFCGPNSVAYGPMASAAIAANTLTHIAGCRASGIMRVFHGGTLMASAADTYDYAISAATIAASNNGSGYSSFYAGYIDEALFDASAKYTANFTPPTAPFMIP